MLENTITPSSIWMEKLQLNEKAILQKVHAQIGTSQVTTSALAFAPPWMTEKSMTKEYQDNWKDAYEEVNELDLPEYANIIYSHDVFMVKKDEQGNIKIKGRIVVHRNRDKDRDKVIEDCTAADMAVIRMVLSIKNFLGFTFGLADIKGAYMQGGTISRGHPTNVDEGDELYGGF